MEVCAKLLSHVCRCTEEKRTFLEKVDRDDHVLNLTNKEFRRVRDREISRLMQELPGKLDHAAVVAFEIGHFTFEPLQLVSPGQPSSQQETRFAGSLFAGQKKNASESNKGNSEGLKTSSSYTELYSLLGV